MAPKHQLKGFTLVELLIVVTLVATIAGLTTAAFLNHFRARTGAHYVQEFVSYLRFLQFKSIEEGVIYKLAPSEKEGAVSAFVQSDTESAFLPFRNFFERRFEQADDFQIRFDAQREIYFFPDGTVTKDKLHIYREANEVATIEIKNRVGAFKVTEYAGMS